MKILIVHNLYQKPGGEDTAVLSDVRMLEHNGHEVILYQRSNNELKAYSLAQKIKLLAQDMVWSARTYQDVRRILQEQRPDVVHVHNTFFMISPSVYDACRDEHVPVVQTLHNYRLLCANAVFFRQGRTCEDCLTKRRGPAVMHRCWRDSLVLSWAAVRVQKAFWQKRIYKAHIQRFIALCEFSKNKFISGGIPGGKISVKPNFLERDPGMRTSAGHYALYAGSLREYKGVLTLLKAWGQFINIPLKIIGQGPLLSVVQKKIQDMPQVQYLGQKKLDEIFDVMKGATFVVVPSECYENFPRIVVESFACGVPVLASDLGALREIVDHWKTGLLFEAGNVQDLISKARELFGDQALALRLGACAREKFLREWAMEENYKKLMEIYEDVLK